MGITCYTGFIGRCFRKGIVTFAVLIIRNHMEKKSLAMLADTEWLRFIFSLFSQYVLLQL